jgi:hypothetical protein
MDFDFMVAWTGERRYAPKIWHSFATEIHLENVALTTTLLTMTNINQNMEVSSTITNERSQKLKRFCWAGDRRQIWPKWDCYPYQFRNF